MSVKEVMVSAHQVKPTITFTEKELPEIKDWKVGKKYELVVSVEMVGLEKDEWDKNKLSARFKVNRVEQEEDDEE